MVFRYFYCFLIMILFAGCATPPPVANTPEAMLKEGERLYTGKRYEEAITILKKVKDNFSATEQTAAAELKIADAQFANKNYIEAVASYSDFRKLHPAHEQSPYALYKLGLSYYHQIGGFDTEQTAVKSSVTIFENFQKLYPGSEYAGDVGKKLEECKIKQLQYEIYVARFYLRTEKYPAAINRLEEALAQFPQARINDETLFYLGEAYLRKGEKVKGEQTMNRLSSEFPASKFVIEAKKLLKKF